MPSCDPGTKKPSVIRSPFGEITVYRKPSGSASSPSGSSASGPNPTPGREEATDRRSRSGVRRSQGRSQRLSVRSGDGRWSWLRESGVNGRGHRCLLLVSTKKPIHVLLSLELDRLVRESLELCVAIVHGLQPWPLISRGNSLRQPSDGRAARWCRGGHVGPGRCGGRALPNRHARSPRRPVR